MSDEKTSGVPEFMRAIVVDESSVSERVVAEQAVLSLNASMMQFYETSLVKFIANMRAQVPIILALFTGAGGQMILYRPSREPEVAPPVPLVYQLAKSVAHSSMAIYEIVAPYLSNASGNQLWRAPLETYRTQNRTALDALGALDLSDDDRAVMREILVCNLAFMDEVLAKGSFTYDEVEAFVRGTVPHSFTAIGIASGAQVGHWMSVVEEWQRDLGDAWDRTYAVSNTLYVARQNNILFSVLVQFMGTETMGDRLLLIETPEFETTPFVSGPPLSQRRIAIVSSAALIKRGDVPFAFGSGECRFINGATPAGDLLISHVSINFDLSGWQRDINVVFPIDRLREMAAAGEIGGIADTHYTVMGSTDPAAMEQAVDQIAGQLKQERIDSVLLSPV